MQVEAHTDIQTVAATSPNQWNTSLFIAYFISREVTCVVRKTVKKVQKPQGSPYANSKAFQGLAVDMSHMRYVHTCVIYQVLLVTYWLGPDETAGFQLAIGR